MKDRPDYAVIAALVKAGLKRRPKLKPNDRARRLAIETAVSYTHLRGRVELVAIVNEFFDKWPIIAQIEDVPAADRAAGIFVPRLKVSDDFRRLVIALRTWQGEGEALPGGAVGGHVAS